MKEITPSQTRAIKLIKEAMLDGTKNHELKRCDAKEVCGDVSLVIIEGMVGDKGTMAAVICRTYSHVFIGRRGGIYVYIGDKRMPLKPWQVKYVGLYERQHNST